MQIHVNGKPRQVVDSFSLAELVETLELGEQRFAIEVNEELVPRSTFARHQLLPGDQVEIVQAIGGG